MENGKIEDRNHSTERENFLAQEVCQKNDTSDRRSNSPPSTLTLFASQPLGHCATCKGPSYTKNQYNLFYHKLDAEYFLFNNFFKKTVFSEKTVKNCFWGHIRQFFREKRRLVPKINITFFYHKLGTEYFII